MSVENVKAFFREKGMEERVLEFDVSSATVALAAEVLHCEPCRIAKTLSFMLEDKPILILTAGDRKISNPKYKAQFAKKAKMLTPDELVELVGHAPGGVCPFAIKPGVTVYLDKSLQEYETVFPACGSSNSAIELTIPELEACSGYTAWIDVCADRE